MSRDLCNSFFAIYCDHAFIFCCNYNILSGIVLEIACSETLHRSGCFDSHIYIYYMCLVGCVSFTFLHKVPIRSYFVEAEDKVTTLQGGYGVCAVKLWGTLLYHLILQNVGNENIQSLCPIIPTSLPPLSKCVIITTVILSHIIAYRSVPGW